MCVTCVGLFFLCIASIGVCIFVWHWPCDEAQCCIATLHHQCNLYCAASALKHTKNQNPKIWRLPKTDTEKKFF